MYIYVFQEVEVCVLTELGLRYEEIIFYLKWMNVKDPFSDNIFISVLTFVSVNLMQSRVIWKEETSTKVMFSFIRLARGELWGRFLYKWLVWEGSAHCGRGHPGQVAPE